MNELTVLTLPIELATPDPVDLAELQPVGPKSFATRAAEAQQIRKAEAFERGLAALIAWDAEAHADAPVFKSVDLLGLSDAMRTFLKRQAQGRNRLTPFMVGVTGPSGAGKGFFTAHLESAFHGVAAQRGWTAQLNGPLVAKQGFDHFYKDMAAQFQELGPSRFLQETNLDEPAAISMDLFQQAVATLREGRATITPQYDFATATRLDRTMTTVPAPFTLVEGLFTLNGKAFTNARTPLYRLFDLRVYVDTENRELIDRRWWRRALEERGKPNDSSTQALYDRVQDGERCHIAPTRANAQIEINGAAAEQSFDETLSRLADLLLAAALPVQLSIPLPTQ